jgi:hypothetical protein
VALEDPFAFNPETFPWLNLRISMGEGRWKKGGEGGLHGLEEE